MRSDGGGGDLAAPGRVGDRDCGGRRSRGRARELPPAIVGVRVATAWPSADAECVRRADDRAAGGARRRRQGSAAGGRAPWCAGAHVCVAVTDGTAAIWRPARGARARRADRPAAGCAGGGGAGAARASGGDERGARGRGRRSCRRRRRTGRRGRRSRGRAPGAHPHRAAQSTPTSSCPGGRGATACGWSPCASRTPRDAVRARPLSSPTPRRRRSRSCCGRGGRRGPGPSCAALCRTTRGWPCGRPAGSRRPRLVRRGLTGPPGDDDLRRARAVVVTGAAALDTRAIARLDRYARTGGARRGRPRRAAGPGPCWR